MKNLLILLLLQLSNFGFASFSEGNVIKLDNHLAMDEGEKIIEEIFSTGNSLYSSPIFIFENNNKLRSYPKGDFVILWGLGDSTSNQEMTENEYKMIWRIMNHLSTKGFRVIMNVRTNASQIKEAVETPGVSVILYSGHGNNKGFYDHFNQLVPYDLFRYKAKSLYQFILSACYGTESISNYQPSHMIAYTWSGLTNTKDLEGFLMNSWDPDEGSSLIK